MAHPTRILFGLYYGKGAATLAISRSYMTKEHSVCRTPIHLREVTVTPKTKIQGASLSQQEQTRLKVLNSVMVGQLPVGQAAEVLGISERHVMRIPAAYREEGAAALVHGNRGRRPANATSEAAIAEVMELAASRYSGTNHTHLSELLMEREGIFLSRSTVRRIALSAGIASPRRRRPPKHRVRRQRMPQEGMLVQVDGSHHRWLEDRGPRFALLLAVDDATGTVPYALFRPEEDAMGYLLLIEGMIERRGVPLALYSDRHAVFKNPAPPRQKLPGPTQFARAMQRLGIRQIFARSPQAKGRVERVAGTFQDRLVTELRLAKVETMEHANEVLHRYLPRFDEQFGVPAAQSEVAYRKPPSAAAVEQALCFRFHRKVAGTTRSGTDGAPCSCCLAWSGPATPEHRWKSLSVPMVDCWLNTRGT